MNTERIRQRGQGRQVARSVLALLGDGELNNPESIAAFLDELATTLQPSVVAEKKLSDQRKLSELAAKTLEFGSHAGERLDDIDRGYLHWLAGATEETLASITAYLEATKHLDETEA